MTKSYIISCTTHRGERYVGKRTLDYDRIEEAVSSLERHVENAKHVWRTVFVKETRTPKTVTLEFADGMVKEYRCEW